MQFNFTLFLNKTIALNTYFISIFEERRTQNLKEPEQNKKQRDASFSAMTVLSAWA